MGTKNIHSNKPRLVGGIVSDILKGWHRNTDLAVDQPLKIEDEHSIYNYVLGVFDELLLALESLVEKR